MSEKAKAAKGHNGPGNGKTSDDKESFGEALSKDGFKPANVESRKVSQGRRRETLKKKVSKDSDK